MTVDKLLGGFILAVIIFFIGFGLGKSEEYAKYLQDELVWKDKISELNRVLKEKNDEHVVQQQKLLDDIILMRVNHEKDLLTLNDNHTLRLQQSEKRSEIYRKRAASSPDQCRQLAEHTARLDYSLEEGRGLVREFTAVVRQLEQDNKKVIEYLLNDREHLNDR